jgi:hypothetical protein
MGSRSSSNFARDETEADGRHHGHQTLLAALSFIVAVLAGPGLVAWAAAAEQAPKQETLSETYRVSRANDVEFQKIAPFKVFDTLYYAGPGYVSVWLIPNL